MKGLIYTILTSIGLSQLEEKSYFTGLWVMLFAIVCSLITAVMLHSI